MDPPAVAPRIVPVTLAAVEAHPLRLPLLHPMRLASETVAAAETLLVRVVDTDGQEGWGEASSAPTMTGELLPGMVAVVERFLGPALLAAAVPDGAEAERRLARAIRGNSGARAACATAVLDLLARRAGLPLATLLGTALRDAVPAIRMVGEADPEATLAAVRAAAAEGFGHVKLKVGLGAEPEADAALVAGARAALGPASHLSADANMAWDAAAAVRFLRALPEGALDYLEQPVADDDLDGMAVVAGASAVPICVDEGLHGPDDIARHAERRAASGVGLKAIKLGGPLATLAAEAAARRHGMNTTLACKIAESSVGAAALLHLAAVVPTVDWGVSVTHPYLAEDATVVPVQVEAGRAHVPPGPGHGAVPDPARLRRHRWRG